MREEGIELSENERTRCEVWTRVMGYHRPVTAFNPGKQSEHRERTPFLESRCAPLIGAGGSSPQALRSRARRITATAARGASSPISMAVSISSPRAL